MSKKKIAILGAGTSGLALGMNLLRRKNNRFDITIFEKESYTGGICASFKYEDIYFDFGSHRLHPSTPPDILDDIKFLLKQDLLTCPRNGRIRLMNRFLKFPFSPKDILFNLPPSFAIGFMKDVLIPRKIKNNASFADVLSSGLGKTICEKFYFPYAEKLWGLNANDISPEQAKRRVKSNSKLKIFRKVFSSKKQNPFFYYPAKGFGEICETIKKEFLRLGGKINLSADIKEIMLENNKPKKIIFSNRDFFPDFVFSTIPIPSLINTISNDPTNRKQADEIKYRSMVFCYIVLDTPQFTPYDAHYFPEKEFVFSRISEPKNYYSAETPSDKTGICLEIPCSYKDKIWNMKDDEIIKIVLNDLKKAGLPIKPIKNQLVKQIRNVYPIYDLESTKRMKTINKFLDSFDNLISFGRQGLFIHDNIHHAIEMAYRVGECLSDNAEWDDQKWKTFKQIFQDYVVED